MHFDKKKYFIDPKFPSVSYGTKSLSFMLTIFHTATKGLIYLVYVVQKQCTGPHKNSILAAKKSANKRLHSFWLAHYATKHKTVVL